MKSVSLCVPTIENKLSTSLSSALSKPCKIWNKSVPLMIPETEVEFEQKVGRNQKLTCHKIAFGGQKTNYSLHAWLLSIFIGFSSILHDLIETILIEIEETNSYVKEN